MQSAELNTADGIDSWIRRSRFAQDARVGDCVLTLDDQHNVEVERIVKIGRQFSTGIYSPITVEGTLITNGILSSCFSQIESHATQKMAFDVLMMFYNAFGYLTGVAYEAVHDIPIMLNHFHQLSWYILPFAKY
ncbi:hypothetical protein M3Y94_01228600 [Aphelenchoides besseyi]|nr:hypothetical protein M3Y94_01228600 [Aphelenchoides besseyi]